MAYSAFPMLWSGFALSWMLAAGWQNQSVTRPGFQAEALYRLVQVVGFGLLLAWPWLAPFNARLWRVNGAAAWALLAAAAAGFAFCWWARLHLGALWSASVRRKADHKIIDTGPYSWVRHPIYTGLIFSAFATAVATGEAASLAGAGLITVGFWLKARLEERFLRQELGVDAYDSYRRRTPMLIPFAPP